MTERSRASLARERHGLTIGPSTLRWTGSALEIEVREWAVPIPRRVRGRIRVHPGWLSGDTFALDAQGRHRWGPIAPRARIEIELDQPSLRWQGDAYIDANSGTEPVETPFASWDWSRAPLRDGSAGLLYDVRPREGPDRVLALRFAPSGAIEPFAPPPRAALPRSAWRVARAIRSDAGGPAPRVGETLEDTPFYVRSVVESSLLGEWAVAMHESLDVPRLTSGVVQWMLPWRMPRVR